MPLECVSCVHRSEDTCLAATADVVFVLWAVQLQMPPGSSSWHRQRHMLT